MEDNRERVHNILDVLKKARASRETESLATRKNIIDKMPTDQNEVFLKMKENEYEQLLRDIEYFMDK